MLNIQDFETVLEKMLEYEHSCEGEVGNIKIKKDTSWEMRATMTKGLVGRLIIHTPERIKTEDIEPLLKEGEEIEIDYKKFTPESGETLSFYLKRVTETGMERLLGVDSTYSIGKFSLLVHEKEGKQDILQRSLDIIKAYLSHKPF